MDMHSQARQEGLVSHLLMLLPSFSLSPRAPDLATLSLPARSTRLILETFSVPVCGCVAHVTLCVVCVCVCVLCVCVCVMCVCFVCVVCVVCVCVGGGGVVHVLVQMIQGWRHAVYRK